MRCEPLSMCDDDVVTLNNYICFAEWNKLLSSGTSSLRLYGLCFQEADGILSRMEDLISPLASAGVAGQTTFIPGVLAAKFSGV